MIVLSLKGWPGSCDRLSKDHLLLSELSLAPIHSLRYRLVRSRQYASGSVAGFLRFFEISINGERVGTIVTRLAVRLGDT